MIFSVLWTEEGLESLTGIWATSRRRESLAEAIKLDDMVAEIEGYVR